MNPPTDERRDCTSASSAPADALCQGRHQAQRGLPDLPREDSEFGTAIHDAVFVGKDDGLDEQQLKIVEQIREIEDRLLRQAFGDELPKAKVFREQRFWCKVPHQVAKTAVQYYEHSGKPDLVARLGTKGFIIEYKSLPGEVAESSANLQLRDQVVLAARALLLNDVAVAVVQPLVTHEPLVTIYEKADIERAEKEMWARVIASNQPNAPRVAGEVQCKFCKAKSSCKEYALWSKSMLPAPVSIFDVPVAQWTPEQCATFLERRIHAQRWLNECEKAMKERLKTAEIPGWGLVDGDVRHPINNPKELFNRFIALGGTQGQFVEAITVSKAKFEPQVRAVTKLKGKALHAKLEELLVGITDTKQNEPSIERKP